MEIEKIFGMLEAILFASGDPIELSRIAEVLGCDEEQAVGYINELRVAMEPKSRGVSVVQLGDSYQMISKKEYAGVIKLALEVKRNTPLSPAAMEVLAIVAYNQPVTKGFIESIRGVDSSQTVNNLVLKGLVGEAGRLDVPGRPIAYKTTKNFLRCFGLNSLEKLPMLPEPEEKQLTIDDVTSQPENETVDTNH